MRLCKNTSIKYIYNGKYKCIKILFKDMYLGRIPIYVSDDIEDILSIQLSDGSILVILNNSLTKYDETKLNILILISLLKIHFRCDNKLIYVYCAYWYGFNNTINVIKDTLNMKCKDKDYIIRLLENIMISNDKVDIPSEYDILNSLNFVSIE